MYNKFLQLKEHLYILKISCFFPLASAMFLRWPIVTFITIGKFAEQDALTLFAIVLKPVQKPLHLWIILKSAHEWEILKSAAESLF